MRAGKKFERRQRGHHFSGISRVLLTRAAIAPALHGFERRLAHQIKRIEIPSEMRFVINQALARPFG